MNTKILIFSILVLLVGVSVFFVTQDKDQVKENNIKEFISFNSINSFELENMLENKDFVLIDVHTPEQRHIPDTDHVVSYKDTEAIKATISDKDAKVVLYCRSGSMSKIAAQELVDEGYTNVYELEKGLNEWNALGKETIK